MTHVMEHLLALGTSYPITVSGDVVGVSEPRSPGGAARVWVLVDPSTATPMTMVQSFLSGITLPGNTGKYLGTVHQYPANPPYHVFEMLTVWPAPTTRLVRTPRLWRVSADE